jgi:hypothetical protein
VPAPESLTLAALATQDMPGLDHILSGDSSDAVA